MNQILRTFAVVALISDVSMSCHVAMRIKWNCKRLITTPLYEVKGQRYSYLSPTWAFSKMNSMALASWTPFKDLVEVVHLAIELKRPEAYYSLEAILKKHKPDFISLLQNPVTRLTL